MQGTPAAWGVGVLLEHGCPDDVPHLTNILCGGEALSRTLADRILEVLPTQLSMDYVRPNGSHCLGKQLEDSAYRRSVNR